MTGFLERRGYAAPTTRGLFDMVTGFLRIALAALVLCGAWPAPAFAASSRPVVGQTAPDFELTLIDGSKVSLADLKGQVVVLNFWATWCVPCRKELPTLDAYYAAQRQTGLKVFAITTEGSIPLYRLKALFAAMAIPSAKRIKGPYGPLEGVPTNFIIDRAGKLRYAKGGALELGSLNALLVPLLREPAPK
ncbi:hypothetical protein NTCA1_14860 [Novosphingobium sp. TCA1]|nr:hypothetical protein NTCA1_14860 [Novosphingobium sp. TCA1]